MSEVRKGNGGYVVFCYVCHWLTPVLLAVTAVLTWVYGWVVVVSGITAMLGLFIGIVCLVRGFGRIRKLAQKESDQQRRKRLRKALRLMHNESARLERDASIAILELARLEPQSNYRQPAEVETNECAESQLQSRRKG